MYSINRSVWCYFKQGVILLLLWVAFSFAPIHAEEGSADDANGEVTVELLAEALADDSVRDQLVEHLRAISHGETVVIVDGDGEQQPLAHAEPQESTGSKFVHRLQRFAQDLRQDIGHSWQIVVALFKGDDSQVGRIKGWQQSVLSLILTIVVTVAAYGILRRVIVPIFRAVAQWATRLPSAAKLADQQRALEKRFWQRRRRLMAIHKEQEEAAQTDTGGEFSHVQEDSDDAAAEMDQDLRRLDPEQAKKNYVARYTKLRKMLAVVGAFVIDVLAIMVAALIGYVVTTAAFAHDHQLTLFSMQFLTAFFAVEVVKAISRLFFAERFEALRLIPIEEQGARYWHGWFANVVNVGGYGLLVLVPFLQAVFAPSVANVFGSLLMLVVYFYAVGVLWRQRQQVSEGFIAMAERSEDAIGGSIWRISARLWFVVAWIYFTVLLFMTLIDQQNALSFMAQASLQTLLTLMIGGALFLITTSLSSHHVHLSERWNEFFPLLEERLNSYMPIFFQVVRLFLFAGIIFSLLDAWQVMSFQEWLTQGQGLAVLQTILRIVLVCAVAATVWIILASFIEHRLAVSGTHMPSERERTLLMLFKNALVIIISGLTVLIVLSQLGIDIGPLIAGAGVIGLAVGFGAQKLVQDVITGIFIQLENGMNQNDVVEVAGLFGSVEKLTIRSVVIRTLDGGYHLVPFSSIDSVSNHTRDYGYTVGEYVVGHRESVDETMHYLAVAFDDLKHDPAVADSILEDITIQGVTEINQQGVKLRILIKTVPGMQWAVQRSYNRYVKMRFDEAGIEMPYPHSVLHFGRDKKGYASPIDVQMVEALADSKQQTPTGYPPAGQTPRAFPGES